MTKRCAAVPKNSGGHEGLRGARLALLLMLCALLASAAPLAQAQAPLEESIYYVAPGGQCGPGAPCYATIQAAIDAVNFTDGKPDVVKVAAGTYTGLNTQGGGKQVVYIGKDLTLLGGFQTNNWEVADPAANPTIIDAQQGGRAVVIREHAVTLDGFTLTGGDATGLGGFEFDTIPLGDGGGGLYLRDATATVRHCLIHHNTASTSPIAIAAGGGLLAIKGALTLTDCVVRDNSASTAYVGFGGGAGVAYSQRAARLDDNTFERNVASSAHKGSGGGVAVYYAAASLARNVMANNTASVPMEGSGGGLYAVGSTLSLDQNTLQRNVAGKASGLALTAGGGLYASDSLLTLTANQFLTNTANANAAVGGYGLGGGLYVERSDSPAVTSTAQITITAGNLLADNIASLKGVGLGGGACVRAILGTFAGNTLRHNQAGQTAGAGGGLFLGPSQAITTTSRLTVTDNLFEGNQATSAGTGRGGGLYVGTQAPAGNQYSSIPPTALDGNTFRLNAASTTGTGYGGGLLLAAEARTITLTHSLVAQNTASQSGEGWGGGAYLEWSGATVSDATFQENVASQSGAGYGGGLAAELSMPVLGHLQVLTNTASTSGEGWGGGFYAHVSQFDLKQSRLAGNRATLGSAGHGGGLYLDSCWEVSLSANTIVRNAAASSGSTAEGGGLASDMTDPLTMINNIVGANSAPGAGAGLQLKGFGGAKLLFNTIAANTGSGQGLAVGEDYRVVCTDTLIAGHSAAGVVASGQNMVQLDYTLWDSNGSNYSGTLAHTHDVAGQADFVAPAVADFHLGPQSAAIDAGADAGVKVDIDGDSRPLRQGYDIGADEAQPPTPTPTPSPTPPQPTLRYVFLPLNLRGQSH